MLELSRLTRERLTEMISNNLVSSINPLFLSLFYETADQPFPLPPLYKRSKAVMNLWPVYGLSACQQPDGDG